MGRKKYPDKVKDRPAHAQSIRIDLEALLEAVGPIRKEQKDVGVPVKHRGLTMAADGLPGQQLFLGDQRSETRGLKLFAVRRSESKGSKEKQNEGDLATFYVTRSTIESLLKSVQKYEDWSDPQEVAAQPSGDPVDGDQAALRPQRFWFFESAASFRIANVADLWADAPERMPGAAATAEWEVWLRPGFETIFAVAAEGIGVAFAGEPTRFADTVLVNVRATRQQLEDLVRKTAAVVELRSASTFVADYLDLVPEARAELVGQVARRIEPPSVDAPRTTILDTGVNHAHPLLALALPREQCHAVEAAWGSGDHDGHGTKSAGIALFGEALECHLVEGAGAQPIVLTTGLESVAVIAPDGGARVPARDAITRAVDLVERDPHLRVFCLAGTAQGEEENGRQTSTSAALDKLAFGDGVATRLFCVAAGNVTTSPHAPYRHEQYAGRNADHRIQPPGQAINALTVGANTDKTAQGLRLVAPPGDLSPTSRTARGWRRRYAFKPDIVMEGGNHAIDDDGVFSRPSHALMVLTTHRNAPRTPLGLTHETSAATANAAGLATRVLARYPAYRMETLRALMIHAADWNPAMRELHALGRRLGDTDAEAWERVIACYGWGVPDESRLLTSAPNVLTMVIEDELKPYALNQDSRVVGNQMKWFGLPWPAQALRELNQCEVEMRCTLSYFADPDPLADSRDRKNRYASHHLRFDLKRFGESVEVAQQRVNELADVESVMSPVEGAPDDGWVIGVNKRRLGSVHHDIWRGPAFRLAGRDGLSVFPVKGWWSDRPHADHHEKTTRFSLVVSIRTPASDLDLVAEAAALLPNELLVENLAAITN